MLPPFRIRNLRRPSSPPGQQRGQSPPKGCYDSIVQITAPQYDLTISTVPEATLKYVDEDREVITVGSSLELAQRLHEPVARPTKRPEPSQLAQRQTAPPTSPYPYLPPGLNPRPGQEPSAIHANRLLIANGINPMQLYERQFQAFQLQSPRVQLKSIHAYTRNLEEQQRHAKAALLTSSTDSYPHPRDVLMQQAKNLVTRADQQIEAFRLQLAQEPQTATLETSPTHVFDLDSSSQRALSVWCQIQSKNLMDLDSERAEKASTNVQSYSKPSLETFSYRPDDVASSRPDMKGDQALPPARDERQYYFEITNPPQLKSGAPTKAAYQERFGVGGQTLAKETTPLLEREQETNLTIEGKRQAEAAGDTIRARYKPLYKPKDGAGSEVPNVYQNRWASYSQDRPPSQSAASATKTPFLPPIAPDAHKPNQSLLEVFEAELAKLSFDAQITQPSEGLVAATSSIADQLEKSDHVRVSVTCAHCSRRKIRCCNANADPQGRCSNCIRLKKECKFPPSPQLQSAVDSQSFVSFIEPTAASHEPEPTADPPTSVPFVEPPAPSIDPVLTDDPPTSVPCVEPKPPRNESVPTVDPGALLVQTIKSLVHGVGSFTTELRNQVSEAQDDGIATSQNVSYALEHGLRSAFKGFASCVQNIAETVQNASDATRNVADRTGGIDTQVLEGAVRGLQGLAGGITAFGRDLVPTEEWTAPANNNDDASELTAHARVDDISVTTSLPVELVQPSPIMKDGSSTKFFYAGTSQNDDIHEATDGTRFESQRNDHGSPVSALSEGVKELGKSGGDRGAVEAEKEHQDCTACSSLWPDRCYWHESAGLPYKSDTMERGRQSRRSAHRSTSALTYEYVVPPLAFRVKQHVVPDSQDRDRQPHDSRRSRSRSPTSSLPKRISPTLRGSPSGWPRFHGPGPIHLPHDVPDSIHQRRERRQICRSRRQQTPRLSGQQTPRLSDGPLLRRGNDYPAYTARPQIDDVGNHHDEEFGSFGGQGRPYQQRTSEQIHRGSVTDRYRPLAGEDRDWPITQHLRFASSPYQAIQSGALRHHQSTPALRRPHRSFETNKQTLKLPVRTHGGRNELSFGTGWESPLRRAVSRGVPRRYTSLEDVQNSGEDFNSTLDGIPNRALKQGRSDKSSDSRQDPLSSPVVTHFPTLEQFEGATFTGPPRFPPLPSMEPLIPSRPEDRRDGSQESRSGDYKQVVAKATDPTLPKVYPSAWPHPVGETNTTESSGDFFKRMTGLTEASKTPVPTISSARLDSAAPEARLMKPFDPLADTKPIDVVDGTDTLNSSQTRAVLRRARTVVSPSGNYNPSKRRPYSEYFSGDGRMGWDTFVRGYERSPSSASAGTPAQSHASSHPQELERTSTYSTPVVDPIHHPVTNRAAPKAAPVTASTHLARNPDGHPDYPAVHKVQECVDQLTALGFGTEENGGLKRLVVYAQAAEGDLEEAIEMIEEERTAYKQRFF